MLVGVRPYARTLARQAGTMLSRPIRHGCSTHARTYERSRLLLIGCVVCLGSSLAPLSMCNVLSELQMQDTAANVSEVCVETTLVVDTLGPARRRTHGLCVTVRCQ